MPQLQHTIDGQLVEATAAPTIASIDRTTAAAPSMLYCSCGLEATAENGAGNSVCDDCSTDCVQCEGCNEEVETDDSTTINGETYCPGCAENFNTCECCNSEVHNDDSQCINDETICDSCVERNYTRCDDCNEHVHNDNLHSHDGSADICDSCYEDHYATCEDCSAIYNYNNEGHSDNNCNSICDSCYDEHYFHCDSCSETYHNDSNGRCGMCSGCWDNLDCDERAELIVEHEHSPRVEYRDRPVAAVAPAVAVNPVRSNRPSYHACCERRRFNPLSNGCSRTGSYRTFGVELETSSCPGATEMSGQTVFASSSDGTVTGWEFGSDVLSGDAGLDEIERFCELAEENSFAVDSKCGAHAHFGIGDLSDDQKYNVAIAYWMFRDVWTSFVSEARRSNYYSSAIKWRPVVYNGTVNRIEYKSGGETTDFDLRETTYSDFAGSAIDRYYWCNVKAYREHSTIEIRLHAGTISAKKVNFWIIAHLRFIEFVSNLSRESIVREFNGKAGTTLFAALLELMPADVATYLTERAAQFGTSYAAGAVETAELAAAM